MTAVALTVAVAPVPIPLPIPTLKALASAVTKQFQPYCLAKYLASVNRSGPMFCLLTNYDPGWKTVFSTVGSPGFQNKVPIRNT